MGNRVDEQYPELQIEIVNDNEEKDRLERKRQQDYLTNEQVLKNLNKHNKRKKTIRKMN